MLKLLMHSSVLFLVPTTVVSIIFPFVTHCLEQWPAQLTQMTSCWKGGELDRAPWCPCKIFSSKQGKVPPKAQKGVEKLKLAMSMHLEKLSED